MLPVMAQACAETTGALWSSRTMMVNPLSRVVTRTPGGSAGISPPFLADVVVVLIRKRNPQQGEKIAARVVLAANQSPLSLATGATSGNLLAGKYGSRKASKKS